VKLLTAFYSTNLPLNILNTQYSCMYMYVCMYVCNAITFENLYVERSFWSAWISSMDTGKVRIWRSAGQDQGHSSKKARNSLFPQYRTSIGNNSGSVEDRAVKFACSIVFGYGGSKVW